MNRHLAVITLSVGDVDEALAFYTDRIGFTLDVDYHPTSGFRVVQLTPPGPACSVQFGVGLTGAPVGSARATYLVVDDIEAVHAELTSRGVDVSDIRHKSPVDEWQGDWAPGVAPGHRDYASVADFTDPDGNTWLLQEIGYRNQGAVTVGAASGHAMVSGAAQGNRARPRAPQPAHRRTTGRRGDGVTIVPVSALPSRGGSQAENPGTQGNHGAVAAPSDTLAAAFVAGLRRRGLPANSPVGAG